jgi:hypothetical protein
VFCDAVIAALQYAMFVGSLKRPIFIKSFLYILKQCKFIVKCFSSLCYVIFYEFLMQKCSLRLYTIMLGLACFMTSNQNKTLYLGTGVNVC